MMNLTAYADEIVGARPLRDVEDTGSRRMNGIPKPVSGRWDHAFNRLNGRFNGDTGTPPAHSSDHAGCLQEPTWQWTKYKTKTRPLVSSI